MDVLDVCPCDNFVDQGLGDPWNKVVDLLLEAGGPPDLSLRPLLVQLLLGRLLQCPDVVHRHPVVPIHPAKHLHW